MSRATQSKTCFLLVTLLGTTFLAGDSFAPSVLGIGGATASTEARVREAYGRLPMSFEANQGQANARVKFLSRGVGATLFLTPAEAVLVLRPGKAGDKRVAGPPGRAGITQPRADAPRRTVLRMKMVGANPDPAMSGLDVLPSHSNYFIGNDPAAWREGVSNYRRVRYRQIYPGIDLMFHGRERQLEYDFAVAPGANPGAIRIAWEGARKLTLDREGNLIVHTGGGRLIQRAPHIYQELNGRRKETAGGYVLSGTTEVAFRVAAYDHGRPLVIDPVLAYSTYVGGGSGDYGYGIALDGSGNAFVTGYTLSTNFPTAGPLQGANAGSVDVFVTKFNASGSALVYSTYLGGGAEDYGYGIAVDGSGNAYVTGDTWSTDFPTVGPLQGAKAGNDDAFVTKLDASGATLAYSTYLGGGFYDAGYAIAVDGSGNAYVTGFTWSTNFPTASALQGTKGGSEDAFVSKLNAAGSALAYSTYLGGGSFDEGHGIATDASGSAYVTGYTASTDWPTAGPLQGANAGGDDVFVSKLDAAGSALAYSTYLGGGSDDYGNGIAVDGSGNAYVTGYTTSTNFPTASPFQGANAGGSDGFVSKLDAAGSALAYSSYLGGGSDDYGNGIAADGSGSAYVTGYTGSANFPTAGPFQGIKAAGDDAFVTKIGESAPGAIPTLSRLGLGVLLLLLLGGGCLLLSRQTRAGMGRRILDKKAVGPGKVTPHYT